MRYWWVNHNQTFRQEFLGGYIWCPKKKLDGSINHFYETVREVVPGDVIFSFAKTRIQGMGQAQTYCYSCPRPDEFGNVGDAWDKRGWRVDVAFSSFDELIRPIDRRGELVHLLPKKYAPIRENGYGNQGAYLSEIPFRLAQRITDLIGERLPPINPAEAATLYTTKADNTHSSIQEWEDNQQRLIESSVELPETTREALVQARRGQGLFKARVSNIEKACRITKVNNLTHLRASHIKPWRESNDDERLCEGNGLLLTPSIDHLFDRGFISFSDAGELIISPIADTTSINRMGVMTSTTLNVGSFNQDQKYFLDYHRSEILLQSAK